MFSDGCRSDDSRTDASRALLLEAWRGVAAARQIPWDGSKPEVWRSAFGDAIATAREQLVESSLATEGEGSPLHRIRSSVGPETGLVERQFEEDRALLAATQHLMSAVECCHADRVDEVIKTGEETVLLEMRLAAHFERLDTILVSAPAAHDRRPLTPETFFPPFAVSSVAATRLPVGGH